MTQIYIIYIILYMFNIIIISLYQINEKHKTI